jgi:hypothetical protein
VVTRRALAVGWLIVAVLVWNGIFDFYIGGGVREYLQLRAEYDAGRAPEPSMAAIMAKAEHLGLVAATIWSTSLLACGWLTLWLASRSRADVR